MNIAESLIGNGLLAEQRPDLWPMGLVLAVCVFWVWMTVSNSRKEKRKRKDMLAGMKKGDRAMTIGGVIGTIVNIKDDEIVLKVDESTNTKMTFVRGAIQKVLADDEKPTIGP